MMSMSAFNHPLPQVVLTRFGARGEIRTHVYRICSPAPGRLATRANWSGRRDSNSRFEFGRLAGFQLPTLPRNVWSPAFQAELLRDQPPKGGTPNFGCGARTLIS